MPVIPGPQDSEGRTWVRICAQNNTVSSEVNSTSLTQDQTSINSAVSYSHYVRALPLTSKRLPEAFDRVAGLIEDFKHGLKAEDASGSIGKIRMYSFISSPMICDSFSNTSSACVGYREHRARSIASRCTYRCLQLRSLSQISESIMQAHRSYTSRVCIGLRRRYGSVIIITFLNEASLIVDSALQPWPFSR